MKSKTARIILPLLSIIFLFALSSIAFAYGEPGPSTNSPICGAEVPAKPWLYMVKASGSNSVDVLWDRTDRATSWTVAYGVQSGKYIYGVHNFGNGESRGIRINLLPAGKYFFVVRANNGCMPGPFSNEKEAIVGGGGSKANVVKTTASYSGSGGGGQLPSPTQTPPSYRAVSPRPTERVLSPIPTQKRADSFVPPQPTPTPKPKSLWQRILGLFGL